LTDMGYGNEYPRVKADKLNYVYMDGEKNDRQQFNYLYWSSGRISQVLEWSFRNSKFVTPGS